VTVVGFDFGTTNSLVSVVVGGKVIDVLHHADGLPFPSVVRYEGNRVIVGREAKDSVDLVKAGIHGNVVLSPKFLLGQEVVSVGGVERSPSEIVGEVIRHVKESALQSVSSEYLDGLNSAVVTIPVGMTGEKRAALREAFRIADVGIVQFVHEPFAALYGYFRSSKQVDALLAEYDRRHILVVDWGGGTLDVTLCRVDGGRIIQVRNSGSDDVGGDVFDDAIRNTVIGSFLDTHKMAAESKIDVDARRALLHEAERNKIALSTRDSVTFYREGFFTTPEATLEHVMTRDEMEEATLPIVNRGMARITSLLQASGMEISEISLCLVTGGMARMPQVRSRLSELFGAHRVEVPDNSATLISQGAAWIAHDQRRLLLGKSIGIELARGAYFPLLQAGTLMPRELEIERKIVMLYCVDPRDAVAKFHIKSFDQRGSNERAGSDQAFLGSFSVEVDSMAQPFRERLELTLEIDDNLILHVSAWSADLDKRSKIDFYDLEFGISLNEYSGTGGGLDPPFDFGPDHGHRVGDVVVRSNVSTKKDYSLIPGELLYSHPELRRYATREQGDEFVYYRPCALCKRRSSDPLCRCGS